MTKLYVVIHTLDYEGGLIAGIYSSKSEAKRRLEETRTGDESYILITEINSDLEEYV